MTREFPSRPSLDHFKHQARDLQEAHRAGDVEALARVQGRLPGHDGRLSLAKAQTVIAREYGVQSWPQLKALVERRLLEQHQAEASRAAGVPELVLTQALAAVRALDHDALAALLRSHPALLHVQVNRNPDSNLLHEACAVKLADGGRTPADAIAVIDLLLASGLDINASVTLEDSRYTPSWFAVRGDSLDVLRHVLEKGGHPTGIYSALTAPDTLRLLHQHGVDLEQVAHDETPLLHALKNRHLEGMYTLLELGADVNHADSKGATPLHYAVRQYHEPDVIALLLAHGARADKRSNRGATPVDIALRMGRRDVAVQLGGGPLEATPVPPPGGDVRLRPMLATDDELLEEAVAFYERIGFGCREFTLEHSFASLSLGEARFMITGGGTREQIGGDVVVYRCPEQVLARVASATASATVEDPCGLTLRFVPEVRADVAFELELAVADLAQARAFYETSGFAPAAGDPEALQLGSARIRLREHPGPGVRRALMLWLDCDDFDGTYHRLRARLPVNPPEVAFHGSIFFDVRDPDGHVLTFAAPATDI
jgi:hypothetical protein